MSQAQQPVFIDPYATFGEVEADLATIEAWARENGVQKVEGRYRISDVALARCKAELPKYRVIARHGGGRPQMSVVVPVPPAVCILSEPATQPTLPLEPPIAANTEALLDLVANHRGTITGIVTPEIADALLVLNVNNRPMSPRAVDRFIAILRRGAWQNTGEAIIVADNGHLSDGQHRLTAIRRTGIPALCDVRFGIPRQAFAVTGTGARRTTGNALAIAGKPNAGMQAAIGRLLVQHDAGFINRANIQVDGDLVIAATEAEPAIGAVAALIRSFKFKPARTAPFGLCLVLAQRVTSMDQAVAFARMVDGGQGDDSFAPRRLHIRLRDAAMSRERLPQIDVAVLTIRAWNAWIAGRPVHLLKVLEADRTGAGFPKAIGRG